MRKGNGAGDRNMKEVYFYQQPENLQREISIETDKLLRLNMEFMGVILCVVVLFLYRYC